MSFHRNPPGPFSYVSSISNFFLPPFPSELGGTRTWFPRGFSMFTFCKQGHDCMGIHGSNGIIETFPRVLGAVDIKTLIVKSDGGWTSKDKTLI